MKEKFNKWKAWKFDAKHSTVRRRIKRKTSKVERNNAKAFIKKELEENF